MQREMNVRCRFRSDLEHSRSFDRMQVIFSHVSYWLCRDKINTRQSQGERAHFAPGSRVQPTLVGAAWQQREEAERHGANPRCLSPLPA